MSAQHPGLDAANAARHRKFRVRSLVNGIGFNLNGNRRGASQVLRTSRTAGDPELRMWREHNVFSRVEKETRLEQIFAWADEQKPKGKAWGPLTPKEKIILQVMYDARCYVSGRLDFAYSQICRMAKCSSQTLSDAIKKFGDLGLVEKWRRMIPVHNPEPGAPRYTQINNAYFLKLPGEVAKRVRDALGKRTSIVLPPVPPKRQPNEHELQAIAAARLQATFGDASTAARREHYSNNLAATAIARGNGSASSDPGDSSF